MSRSSLNDDAFLQGLRSNLQTRVLFSLQPYLVQLLQVFENPEYLQVAVECGEVVWSRGLLKKGYGLCHGVAGNAYNFLYLFQSTKDLKHLYRACKFAEWCMDYGIHESRVPDRPFSLFEGRYKLTSSCNISIKPYRYNCCRSSRNYLLSHRYAGTIISKVSSLLCVMKLLRIQFTRVFIIKDSSFVFFCVKIMTECLNPLTWFIFILVL